MPPEIAEIALRTCLPAALRKVAFLFADADAQTIRSAAVACEERATPEVIEAARLTVHAAAHRCAPDSAAYAAGHAAAYTAAVAYALYLTAGEKRP
jgi:hypothetical protein